MSSYKKLSKADITTVPYAANKQWVLPFSCPSTSNDYFNVYKGTFITGTFSSNNFAVDPITNGQYERLVYDSINHLFYQAYSGSLLNTSSLMFNTTTYESASQQRPTGAYFDYNTNPNLVKNFPTGAGASIRVLALNQDIYGSKILPYSFKLSSSAYLMTDDGNGNIYSGSTHIGNIFYAHGLAVITNPDYQLMFPLPPVAVNNIATFLSTDTSVKTIPILNNDISRSCALDTGSVVLSGSNSAYYTINANGTITLNATTPGNYDVYYTVNSLCGNGCSLTSNKAKVSANIIKVNPPPCITVEFYGGTPDQNFWFVECGSNTTSSLSLNSTDAPIQRCIEGTFGVSGSSNYTVIGNCGTNVTSSGCNFYLFCGADRAPAGEFYYTLCDGTPVTESVGSTGGGCISLTFGDEPYRCITGSITHVNPPWGSYGLVSLHCPSYSTLTLGPGVSSGGACGNTPGFIYYVSSGSTFQNGTVLYTDPLLTSFAPAQYYSNFTTVCQITGSDGVLTNCTSCSTPPSPSSASLNIYVSAESGSGTITGSEVWYALSSSLDGTQPFPPGLTWTQLSSSFTVPVCNSSPLLVGNISVPYQQYAYVQVTDAGRSNIYYIGYNVVNPCTNGTASDLYTNNFYNGTSGSNFTSNLYSLIKYPVTTSAL